MTQLTKTEADVQALTYASRARAIYKDLIVRGMRDSVSGAIELGDILREIKSILPHGQFAKHVEQYYGWNKRTYQQWMKASETAEMLGKSAVNALLNDDASLLELVYYNKLERVENSAPVANRGVSKPKKKTSKAPSKKEQKPASREEVDGEIAGEIVEEYEEVVEEVEVEEWEYNAAAHQALVDALNAFVRFLKEVMETEESSEYIRHCETRLRADIRDLKATVRQTMPVGVKKNGKILTRNEEQMRKK